MKKQNLFQSVVFAGTLGVATLFGGEVAEAAIVDKGKKAQVLLEVEGNTEIELKQNTSIKNKINSQAAEHASVNAKAHASANAAVHAEVQNDSTDEEEATTTVEETTEQVAETVALPDLQSEEEGAAVEAVVDGETSETDVESVALPDSDEEKSSAEAEVDVEEEVTVANNSEMDKENLETELETVKSTILSIFSPVIQAQADESSEVSFDEQTLIHVFFAFFLDAEAVSQLTTSEVLDEDIAVQNKVQAQASEQASVEAKANAAEPAAVLATGVEESMNTKDDVTAEVEETQEAIEEEVTATSEELNEVTTIESVSVDGSAETTLDIE